MATPQQITQVTELYVALFNRAPDTAGLAFWSDALAAGASQQAVAEGFFRAPEAQAIYSPFADAETFLNTFYTQILGRADGVDADGLAFWTAQLNNAGGAQSIEARALVAQQIIDIVSTPLTERPAGLTDEQYQNTLEDRIKFSTKVDLAAYAATQGNLSVEDAQDLFEGGNSDLLLNPLVGLQFKAELNEAKVANAVANGTTLNGTVYNDVYAVTAADLNAAVAGKFAINGGEGNDSLVVTGSGTVNDTVKNTTSIENIYADGTGLTIQATKFAGATNFVAAGGDVNFTKLAAGQTAGVSGQVDSATFTYADGVSASTVNVNTANADDVIVTGKDVTTLTVNVSGVENSVGKITASTAKDVTVNANSAVAIGALAAAAGSTLKLAGSGEVTFESVLDGATFTTIDASGSSAGLNATVNNAAKFVGSSGADEITLTGAVSGTGSINLGAGDDKLGGNATVAQGAVIDGGEGNNTLSHTLVTAAGNTAASFKNFQTLDVTGATNVNLDNYAFTTIEKGGAAGLNLTNVAASSTLSIIASSGNTNVTVKGAVSNPADTFSIKLGSENAVSAGVVTVSNVETINLASNTTSTAENTGANAIQLNDPALKTLVITGSHDLDLSFSGSTVATSSINASAFTGDLELSTAGLAAATGAGLTIQSGSGNDALTITVASTVTGGAGNDAFTIDVFQAEGAVNASSIAAATVTITDFAQGDSISFGADLDIDATNIVVADYSAQASLQSALDAAIGANAGDVSAFVFGGDTYLVADLADATPGFGEGDAVVKLSGVVDLTQVQVVGGVVSFIEQDANIQA